MILKYLSPETGKWVYFDRILAESDPNVHQIKLVGKALTIEGKGFVDKTGICEWNKYFVSEVEIEPTSKGERSHRLYFYDIFKIKGNSKERISPAYFGNIPIRRVFSPNLFQEKLTRVGNSYNVNLLLIGDQKQALADGQLKPKFVIFFDKCKRGAAWFLLNDAGDTVERL